MESWVAAILSVVTAIGGAGIGGWIVKIYSTRKSENRQDQELATKLKLSENAQAFEFMKEVVATLKTDLKDVNTHIQMMERENVDCREENAKRREEIAKLTTELAIAKNRLDYLEKSFNEKPKNASSP